MARPGDHAVARPHVRARPLILFDGDCGFCQRCVAFAQVRDRRGLAFEPWQDADLPEAVRARARGSVLWLDAGTDGADRLLDQSAAVVRVLWSLRLGWQVAGVLLWLVPKPLRDAGYRAVARRWGPLGDGRVCAAPAAVVAGVVDGAQDGSGQADVATSSSIVAEM